MNFRVFSLATLVAVSLSSTPLRAEVDLAADVRPQASTYVFDLVDAGFYFTSGTLFASARFDYDTYVMTALEPLTAFIDVTDTTSFAGGVVCVGLNYERATCATGPGGTVHLEVPLDPGTYTFYVGYRGAPPEAPSTYDFVAEGFPPPVGQ